MTKKSGCFDSPQEFVVPHEPGKRTNDKYDLPSVQDKPVLVTGATGFTGGALASELVARGYRVRALVRNKCKAKSLESLGVELIEGDIVDPDAVMHAAEGVDLIHHVAAVFRTSNHGDEYYDQVNHQGVKHVIAAARRHGVERTVHCSTVGVHGHVSEIPSNESAPYNPGDIYQVTKLEGEKRMQEAIAEGFPGVIFRPAGIYGPGDMRFLKLFKNVQRGCFPIFGSGDVMYHFTYIDDLVDGIIRCGEHPKALGEILILCGEDYITLNAFVDLVATYTNGRAPKVRWPIAPLLMAARLCEAASKPLGVSPPLHVRRCEFFTKARAFSNEKARDLLGWKPRFSNEDGVRRTAQWYIDQGLIRQVK